MADVRWPVDWQTRTQLLHVHRESSQVRVVLEGDDGDDTAAEHRPLDVLQLLILLWRQDLFQCLVSIFWLRRVDRNVVFSRRFWLRRVDRNVVFSRRVFVYTIPVDVLDVLAVLLALPVLVAPVPLIGLVISVVLVPLVYVALYADQVGEEEVPVSCFR